MMSKEQKRKLGLFINQPGFLKRTTDLFQTTSIKKADSLKSIFPPTVHLERFKHLQNARESGKRDLALDTEVFTLIHKFEREVKDNSSKNQSLENKRQNCLKKLKMDYVEQQMSQNLQELHTLIGRYGHLNSSIKHQKGYVEKMIMMTSIKNALTIQNDILKKQNDMLKKQEEEVDGMLKKKKK